MRENIFDLLPILKKWDEGAFHFLPKILLAVLVLILFYALAKIIQKILLKTYVNVRILKKQADVAKLVSSIIYIVLILAGVFLALEILGLESVLTKLLAGAGIIGIIAGFAFKDIASNMFAGLLLNIQKPFKDNDWVMLDGKYGSILKIGWITTSIKSISGQEVYVPNQLIYNSTFTNYSTFNQRRIILKSGVSYGDDLDKVKQVALDEINQIKALLKSPGPDFYFTNIGGYAYNFEVRFWIEFKQQTDYLDAMSEAIMRIKKRFEQENISIAYPVQTLDFGVKGGVNIFDKPIELQK
ncbi:MAG: mechanosensitive ion channel family protein [Bacteroidetes bacterium]|nr:mechanosensitive ion channel family protein [Bacteroidota bacterium]